MKIPGTKTLVMGRAGAGKTYSTRTLFNIKGLQPFHAFIEPSMVLVGNIPEAKYNYTNPMGAGVNKHTLMDIGRKINTLGNEDLQKGSILKPDFTQWMEFIDSLNNFTDQDGKAWGDVEGWNTDRVLVIDGLTGLTRMSRGLAVGAKPLLTQPDFGVIMENIYVLLQYLTLSLTCHVVLISHLEMERDEINGGLLKTCATIGRKLAPTIPPMFDDVVIAEKIADQFTWTTIETGSDTKNRNLPLANDLKQDFAFLLECWQKNGGVIEKTEVKK